MKRITMDGWFRIRVPDDHPITMGMPQDLPLEVITAAVQQAIAESYWAIMKIQVEELDEYGELK